MRCSFPKKTLKKPLKTWKKECNVFLWFSTFFYVLFLRFVIFVWLMKPIRAQRFFAFFSKERKERCVLFKRTPERCVLLKRMHAQPWILHRGVNLSTIAGPQQLWKRCWTKNTYWPSLLQQYIYLFLMKFIFV